MACIVERESDAAGVARAFLAAAVRRTGGGAYWARVLNMPAPQPARWADALIEAELRRVCAGSTRWPTRAEFARARATGVLRAVYAGRGSRWWANRLGLSTEKLRTRRSTRPISQPAAAPAAAAAPSPKQSPETRRESLTSFRAANSHRAG